MPVGVTDFKEVMATVPAPVVVLTTLDAAGRPRGVTASSFTSLSVAPPQILTCVDMAASTHDAFVTAQRFLVNVLSAQQPHIAARFATSSIDRFAANDMEPCEFGLPGSHAAVARMACSLQRVLDGGDHSIVIGQVEAIHVTTRQPLLHWRRAYGRPVLRAAG